MWLTPEFDTEGNFWYPPGTTVTTQTPLAPFRVPDRTRFYNTNDMRDWQALGYT